MVKLSRKKIIFLLILLSVFYLEISAYGNNLENIRTMVLAEDEQTNFKGLDELEKLPKNDQAASILIEALDNPSENVRASIVVYLKSFGAKAKRSVPALIEAFDIKGDHYLARTFIPETLGSVGAESPEVIQFLMRVAEDSTEAKLIRFHAIQALGNLGGKSKAAIPLLNKMWETDPEKALGISALETLVQIDPQNKDYLSSLIILIKKGMKRFLLTAGVTSSTYHPADSGLRLLIKMEKKDEVYLILNEYLDSGDPKKQHRALSRFMHFDYKRTKIFPKLIRLLKQKPKDKITQRIQNEVLSLLVRIEPTSERVINLLREIVENKDSAQEQKEFALLYLKLYKEHLERKKQKR